MARTSRSIHNGLDIIDSRDVIARISDLEGELQDRYDEAVRLYDPQDEEPKPADDFEEWLKVEHDNSDDDATELLALRALAEEASGSPDWTYGEALIRDSYFETYAQELAEDIGAVQQGASWPNDCIDWERAASELQYGYFSVDYDGVTYWIRS